MKRLITFLLLFLAVEANAQVIYWWEDSQFVGNLKTNVNKSFSNVVAAIASASGGAQSPFTNDLDAAGNSIENLDAPEITNTTIFIRLWGTNVLSLQGTTNIALNGVSLKDGGADGNTPQGPWTNWMAAATWGVSNAGTYHLADTNTILFMLGTNRFEVQGGATTPTNLAWNGSSLINPAGSGGGGAYAYQGTNNIIHTNANGSTIAANAVGSIVMGGATNTVGAGRDMGILSGKNNVISNQGAAGYAVIAGGDGNIIGGDPSEAGWYGFIGAGLNNRMHGDRGSVVGGQGNVVADQAWYSCITHGLNCSIGAGSTYSFAGGGTVDIGAGSDYCVALGHNSTIQASADENVLAGGADSIIYTLTDYGVISGGRANTIAADYATVGGGQANTVGSAATHSTVSGGNGNDIGASATYATVGGGLNNDEAGQYGTIAGGKDNTDAGTFNSTGGGENNNNAGAHNVIAGGKDNNNFQNRYFSFIGGGARNTFGAGTYMGDGQVIAGGYDNSIKGEGCAIGGGINNVITNDTRWAEYSVIPGGADNRISSVSYAFAAGRFARITNDACFVWAGDAGSGTFSSTATNQFLIRAQGGVRIASHGGGQDTNTWAVTGMRIVTNANVFIHTPAWQGCHLLDVGSNRIYYAVGLTTNDWKGTNLN